LFSLNGRTGKTKRVNRNPYGFWAGRPVPISDRRPSETYSSYKIYRLVHYFSTVVLSICENRIFPKRAHYDVTTRDVLSRTRFVRMPLMYGRRSFSPISNYRSARRRGKSFTPDLILPFHRSPDNVQVRFAFARTNSVKTIRANRVHWSRTRRDGPGRPDKLFSDAFKIFFNLFFFARTSQFFVMCYNIPSNALDSM